MSKCFSLSYMIVMIVCYISTNVYRPFVRGGERFWRLYPDGWVPFSRRKHNHLVQELIDTSQQVLSVLGLIRNVMEDLDKDVEGRGIQG